MVRKKVLMSQSKDKSDMVTIPRKEYDDLLDDSLLLNCLEGAGVDNWQGYDYAMEEYQALTDTENQDKV